MVYLVGILFTLTCTAYVDAVRIISWSRKGGSTTTDGSPYRGKRVNMHLFYPHATVHPVPEKWVALGGVNLRMEFVGFLAKLGILFVAFLDSMHRMGSNTVFWVMLMCAASMQTIQGRVDSTLSTYRYPHKAITNGINRHKNTMHCYKKEIWRLDTETLIEKDFS